MGTSQERIHVGYAMVGAVAWMAILMLSSPVSGQDIGFEATLSGAVEATLEGDDATWRRHDYAPGISEDRAVRIDLNDAARDNCILTVTLNVRDAAEGTEAGTYEISNRLRGEPYEVSTAVLTCYELVDDPTLGTLNTHHGTVTIDSVDGETLTGSFELVMAKAAELAAETPETEIALEGAFTAEYSLF